MEAMKRGTTLITGASSGIGRELAHLFAAKKHDLVLVARSADRLTELAEEVRKAHGVSASTFAVDLGRAGSAKEVHEFTQQSGLTIEVLVNNAGIGLYDEHTGLAEGALAGMLQLNIATVAELCRCYGAEMKSRRSGRILNVASLAAYQPTPFFAAYGASKAFVLNFSEALAMELGEHGVAVSCLSPGPTDTAFFGDMDKRGIAVSHFADRDSAKHVARIGFEMVERGQLSRIVGAANNLLAFTNRLAPRSVVAKIAKGLMRAAG